MEWKPERSDIFGTYVALLADATGKPEEALQVLDTWAKHSDVKQITRGSLIKLKESLEAKNITFPYIIPASNLVSITAEQSTG